MRLKILTPERAAVDAENVEGVFARSPQGEFGVLKGHIPMVCSLSVGMLSYRQGARRHAVAVMGGVLETDGESVVVLSPAAELSGEIDALRAEHARERAESRLRERQDFVDVKRAELALARAMARLKASTSASLGE